MTAKDKISEDIGYIKGKIDSLDTRFEAQDKKINGTMEAFRDHVQDGRWWRGAVICSVVAILLEAFNLFSQSGQSRERMNTITKDLTNVTIELSEHIKDASKLIKY